MRRAQRPGAPSSSVNAGLAICRAGPRPARSCPSRWSAPIRTARRCGRRRPPTAYNARYKRYAFGFSQFRSTNGYVSVPLDAIWTRAPYLHNGSVPTLRDLLRAPQDRPKVFYRGYNVFEPKDVGFVSQGPEAQRNGFRYETSQPGNSNQGHLSGTQLSDRDKDALLEYLKTL